MDIVGFENYLIYEDGRVLSKKRNRFLSEYTDKKGYIITALSNNGDDRRFKNHRLVALHYVKNDNPDEYDMVDHIDRNKKNNHYTNLRWVNNQMNTLNRGKNENNTSGHKNIHYRTGRQRWLYVFHQNGKKRNKSFMNKIDCICYKYIYLLKESLLIKSVIESQRNSIATQPLT